MVKTSTTVDTRSSKAPSHPPPAISYRLSASEFWDNGWTVNPNKPVPPPMVFMKAKFSHSTISPWFQRRQNNLRGRYPDGKTVYLANTDGTGVIYYPNGRKAVVIEKGGLSKTRTRIRVFGPGEVGRDGLRRPAQLCAVFDSLGNGVVYDQCMKKRLVYNQTEGELKDSCNGLPVHWKWHDLAKVLPKMTKEDKSADTPKEIIKPPPQMSTKRMSRRNVETQSISANSQAELQTATENPKYLNSAKLLPKQVTPLKPIVLQLNSYITLRVLEQSDITLSFFAKCRQTQLKIGILYNPFEKHKVVEVIDKPHDRVLCSFEDLPPKTISMLKLNKMLQRQRNKNCRISLKTF